MKLEMSGTPEKIGFAAGVLCEGPVRFDVLEARFGCFFAVNKPAGILADSYAGAYGKKSMVLAMRTCADKPELLRLGIKSPYCVAAPDFEISGAALFACGGDFASAMRNALWSGACEFDYLLICEGVSEAGSGENIVVDLPVCRNADFGSWRVSHKYGKKARTEFSLLECAGGKSLWSARASNVRPHQIRLHAAEAGLRILGENLYGHTSPLMLSSIKKGVYKKSADEKERPIYPHICAHLSKITFKAPPLGESRPEIVKIFAPFPKGFCVCLKRLGFEYVCGR